MRNIFLIWILLVSSLSFGTEKITLTDDLEHLEKVSLQLKWFHQFQFAGYYAAKEKGYYEQEGLLVDILEINTKKDTITQVVNGEVNFAVGDSGILLHYSHGDPVIALAAIFQHNPLVFISKRASGIISPYEMKGKRIMFHFIGGDDAPLRAILSEANLDDAQYILVNHTFKIEDFLLDKVDVISAYLSNEPFDLKKRHIPFNVINPQNYGIDFYGDLLFTSKSELENHPHRVEKFRRATIKGWDYALRHPDEIIQIIHDQYHSQKSIEHLRFEADIIRKLILPESIPLGQIEPHRLRSVADTYARLHLSRPLTDNDIVKFIYKNQTLNLTEEEKVWLKNHPILRLGIDRNFPPYEWINEKNSYVGLAADYFSLFEKLLGVKFKVINNKPWNEVLDMAKTERLDLLSLVADTPEREKFLLFTPPYTENFITIFTNKKHSNFINSLDNLNFNRVAIEKGYFLNEILQRDYPKIQLIQVNSTKEALTQVTEGKAEAYVGDALTVHYLSRNYGLEDLVFSGNTGYSNPYSIAVIKKYPELASIMTKAIAAIPSKERERIKEKWMSTHITVGLDYRVLLRYGLMSIAVLLVFLIWNWRLRLEISRRKAIAEELRTLSVAVEQSPASVVITDLSANLLYVNPRFTQVTGYSSEEVIGKNPKILQSGLTSEATYQNLWNTLKEGQVWHGELINRRKNGELYWELAHIAPVKDLIGMIRAYVGVKIDITERQLAEEKMRLLFELSPIGFALNDLTTGKFIEVNQALYSGTGYTKEELLNLSYWDLTPIEYEVQERQQLESLHTTGRYGPYEKEYCRKDGSRYPVRLSGMLMQDAKGYTLIWSIVEDITEFKEKEKQLYDNKKFFQLLSSINPVGIYRADTQGVCSFVNEKCVEITGRSQKQLLGFGWLEAILAEDREMVFETWHRATREHTPFRLEYRFQRPNKSIVWVYGLSAPIQNEEGSILGYIGVVLDITERKNAEDTIKRLAFYDPLTQLPNRRLLSERLHHAIEISRRTGKQMAVFMLDLDKFKAVNDTLGHAAGDELLKQVSERLLSKLRKTDTVARLGGDEFTILLENIEHDTDTARIAQTIIVALHLPFTVCQDKTVHIGTSIGIALYPQHGETIDTLMDKADMALYQAKDQGRGCFAYFSDALTQKALERIELEHSLRRAIEQAELQVYFHPQVSVKTGRLVGAEVLLRWHDPVKGIRMPQDFIALAEETGLIVQLGEQVLRETCTYGRAWQERGLPPIVLAVNVSTHQFHRCNLGTLIIEILEKTGYPPKYLELEITESGLMKNQEHILSVLHDLHQQDIRLAIDDFGTGYSSLAYLKHFPITQLKIDKSFIDGILLSERDRAIISAVIPMAHHLGFKVLAEGVENEEQLEFLYQKECDYYQGYLYAKPLSALDFEQLLSEESIYPDMKC